MVEAKYIYRMDDITPEMDWDKFWDYIDLFKQHQIKPLLGVVPDNQDSKLMIKQRNEKFWYIMRDLQKNNMVEFAQHGYTHVYETTDSGILKKYGFKKQSEFAGLPYEIQYKKIKMGQDILKRENIITDIWMAPSHTFDNNTLKVLNALGFKYITDGIALFPYVIDDLLFVPQQMASPRRLPFGIVTVCIHANGSDYKRYNRIKSFIEKHSNDVDFSDIKDYQPGRLDKLLNFLFRNFYILLSKIKKVIFFYS